jgi:hypothetical protein
MRSVTYAAVLRSLRHGRRPRRLAAGAAAVALALTACPAITRAAAASPGQARVAGLAASHLTAQNDATASVNDLRTGWDRDEPGLHPSVRITGTGLR